MKIPSRLFRLVRQEGGESWVDALPGLTAECIEAWSLRALGEPFADSSVSLVLPAELPNGRPVVLKLQFPHRESEHEAEALELWSGDGAVQLVASDVSRKALLIERCLPGVHLSTEAPEKAISVLTSLLPRLWKPAGNPFTPLREEAALWRQGLARRWETAGQPFERRLLDAASEILRDLADTQGEQVLIHQDLHGDNVLAADREPWLAIDPKPVVGEREFAVAPIVRSYELGHSRQAVWRRLDRLSSELGLDRERARLWSFAQTLAWAFDGSSVLLRHVETAPVASHLTHAVTHMVLLWFGGLLGTEGHVGEVRWVDEDGVRRVRSLNLTEEQITSETVLVVNADNQVRVFDRSRDTGVSALTVTVTAVIALLFAVLVLATVRGFGFVRGTGRPGVMTPDEVEESLRRGDALHSTPASRDEGGLLAAE